MRVMPLDAAYAHCFVVAKYKAVNNGKTMQLKFDVVKMAAGITDVDTIDINAETLVSNVADADGYKALPLFAFVRVVSKQLLIYNLVNRKENNLCFVLNAEKKTPKK